ncbi:hypothetical protein PSN45_000436 [Yamadazyma tenuis]|uniref:DUF833-domain-containing protein n=1 Tax=Candida tenuis (strain ATCC 10573 / BCRC 21748 / CBS 615 / JCM 9827 / NBRC 10315 / NRRL Y-1498 / VKM Y-70) TaxID=590646 RepID=G3B8J6_CANTC|nr:DUF833-domain-containing protein [Yamadazyma tenuis ATCC 10573]XP_006688812.1 uncharacterized protein CANTEDRAFT_115200 [Yamadazyma tenuis ATCC 10573]EGV62641.1 DUF833-domain-containing protein [Yamadazyma tenuis ATCC 10573]EGV62642.1 hypothetical protein CANTEDRAFT_115200 [Yamadazyma tenuis ATCC 10573]WEJ92978.1 hypothetical protein PSN45_000436 [Yamadazyma tenuis]
MCILLASTESPDYPFILLSNRDEYFRRPTENARFRPLSNRHILSPADLGRAEHGTWIGVDTTGKLAVLVNYRESDDLNVISEVSRGIIPVDYLSSDLSDEEWYDNLEKSLALRIVGKKVDSIPLRRVGGFSLLYGQLKLNDSGKINKLNIISNRGDKGTVFDFDSPPDHFHSNDTTIGLSNSLFYEPWNKVHLGRRALHEVINKSTEQHYTQQQLVEELFKVLSTNSYDQSFANKSMKDKLLGLRDTICVPPLETQFTDKELNDTIGKYYGTRTQTIILLDKHGVLHYYEKVLYSSDDLAAPGSGYQHFTVNVAKQ